MRDFFNHERKTCFIKIKEKNTFRHYQKNQPINIFSRRNHYNIHISFLYYVDAFIHEK